MSCRPAVVIAACLLPLLAATARADTIRIGRFSDQASPQRAVIGANIHVAHTQEGERRTATPQHGHERHAVVAVDASGSSAASVSNPYPSITQNSPLLRNPRPAGPGSFWYGDGNGHACMYLPNSVLPCFTVVARGGNAAGGVVSPAAVAASVARRIALNPGEVKASPSRAGLTGADAWFWLDPAPQRRELSVSLGGETVTVTADPQIEWRFGDGATSAGSPGVPYEPGAVPAGAIRHVYETRCLPGDQGRNPYVLGSCGADGYRVVALVVWQISYDAAGPVAASGALPARTTESSTAYPVSEARAFLVSGGGA